MVFLLLAKRFIQFFQFAWLFSDVSSLKLILDLVLIEILKDCGQISYGLAVK